MTSPAVSLRGITRVFQMGDKREPDHPAAVHALRGIDLDIAAGEYVSIMGASGSGKSTLLNILGCLDRPTAGMYRLDGAEVEGLPESELSMIRRNKIGFVFQFFHLVPRMTAAANIELPMIFAGIDSAERRNRIRATLDQVGLASRASHRPPQLSGGECQRVAIARAIVMNPRILLADEPTGNLDSVTGHEIIELLEKMNREGLTLIMVTHDNELGRRASRCIRLADGAIVQSSIVNRKS